MACTVDLRSLDEGFGGKTYKRKRSEQADEMASVITGGALAMSLHIPIKRLALSNEFDMPVLFSKPTYAGVISAKISGRKWKDARTRRHSAMNASKKPSSYEQRAKEKQIKMAYRERMGELKEEIRSNKADKRKKRQEREKKKQENVLRTGSKLQVISNLKTIKKMAKSKQRKLLKSVPDSLLSNNSKDKKKN